MDRVSVFDKPKQITAIRDYNKIQIITAVKQHIDNIKGFESYTGDKMESKQLEKRLNVWIEGLEQKVPEDFQNILDKKMNG